MNYKVLDDRFYIADAVYVARALLGKILVHYSNEGITSGIIVETEAYSSRNDPACHAFRGKTKRNAVMFGPAGRAYVYFIYGNHYCFNVVTSEPGIAEAVLIRGLEPYEGIQLMKLRRGDHHPLNNLTSGPGKLCAAMSIGIKENGLALTKPPLYIADGVSVGAGQVCSSRRIGISQATEKQWRFYIKHNPFVSRLR